MMVKISLRNKCLVRCCFYEVRQFTALPLLCRYRIKSWTKQGSNTIPSTIGITNEKQSIDLSVMWSYYRKGQTVLKTRVVAYYAIFFFSTKCWNLLKESMCYMTMNWPFHKQCWRSCLSCLHLTNRCCRSYVVERTLMLGMVTSDDAVQYCIFFIRVWF